MKWLKLIVLGFVVFILSMLVTKIMSENKNTYINLTPHEEAVIIGKGTEAPFTGEFYNNWESGVYICKRCEAPLYKSEDKFDANCGWPSFDDEIPGAVKRQTDTDGHRTEILCNNCGGHLGHIFLGEGFTEKNARHCINSISMNFIPEEKPTQVEKAYFAGGCFWGVEYHFRKTEGVVSTTVGYMGGSEDNPTYAEVCNGSTNHAETMEVVFDAEKTSFEELAKLFFEIHDPSQENRQGPDVGRQYRSAIFYTDDKQRQTSEKLIDILGSKGYDVVTELAKANSFWPAEDYHQDYYSKKNGLPYCHSYKKIF